LNHVECKCTVLASVTVQRVLLSLQQRSLAGGWVGARQLLSLSE
jgi:hypothetical protein